MSAVVHDSPTFHNSAAPSVGLYSRRSLPLLVTFIIVVSLLVGFFGIYLCRYVIELFGWPFGTRRRLPNRGGGVGESRLSGVGVSRRGLDPGLVAAFPIFPYAKDDAHQARNGRECAVCLGEFSPGDVLRLITGCYHVFHQDCIDLWLDHHTTCPVCRLQLDPAAKSPEYSSTTPETDAGTHDPDAAAGHVVLEVADIHTNNISRDQLAAVEFPVPGAVPEPVVEPEEVFLGRNCVTAAQLSSNDLDQKARQLDFKTDQTEQQQQQQQQQLPCSSTGRDPTPAIV